MGKVHGNNPQGVSGEAEEGTEKLPPPVVTSAKSREGTPDQSKSREGTPNNDQSKAVEDETVEDHGKGSPVVNGVVVKDADVTEESGEQAQPTDDPQAQRHPTPILQNDMTGRVLSPKSDGQKSRTDSPKSEQGQGTFTVEAHPDQEKTQETKTPEQTSTPGPEVEQNEQNEQESSEKPASPKTDSQSPPGGSGDAKVELAASQIDRASPGGLEGDIGDSTKQTDRPISVKQSRKQSVESGSDAKRASPVASNSVPAAAGGDAKVVPKEPEGKELELCDAVRSYIRQLKQMKTYDNTETLELVKAVSQSYWKGTEHRLVIALVLCEDGFPALATHALKTLNAMGIFKNDSIWFPSYYFLNTVWNFSDCSPEFATDVADVGLLDLLVANVSHKPYLENLSSKNVTYIVKSSLSIMHNVARAPDTTPAFKDLLAEEALLPFAKGSTDNEFLQALAVLTLAHIIDDFHNFAEIGSGSDGVIGFIVDCMKKALSSQKRRFRGFLASELAEGLAKLAAQDSAKSEIIKAGALPVFTNMLKSPDTKEQHAAAQAIWVLAFDEDARKVITEEGEVMRNLEALMKSPDEDVKLSALGALWILRKKLVERSETRRSIIKRQTTLDLQKDIKERLLFISYSWRDKKKVRKIAARLKELGYNIWIDTEQMKENILQAMAQGIEDCSIFLMCMSESYKESPNARTEAEYAFKLQKPVIPLMMQKRYRPDGWLGIILGTKLYFNFSGKVPFEEIFDKFLKEMGTIGEGGEVANVVVHADTKEMAVAPRPPTRRQDTYRDIRAWTNVQVNEWLVENNLSSCQQNFQDFDGHHWCGLLQMKKEAPEYFYQSCDQKIGLSFPETLKLADAIRFFMQTHDL